MRKLADAAEAASVLTATGSVLVDSYDSSSASVPLFAAVSPKRDSGPCPASEHRSSAVARSVFKCFLPHNSGSTARRHTRSVACGFLDCQDGLQAHVLAASAVQGRDNALTSVQYCTSSACLEQRR